MRSDSVAPHRGAFSCALNGRGQIEGWRVFIGEVGTILIGVLLALGAQEFVQSLHWKREVRETREALNGELSRDLAVFDYATGEISCINDRAEEIRKWAESFRIGKPLQLKHEIVPPPGFMVRTEAWEIIDGEIASRIPLQSRLNYAGLYSSLRTFNRVKEDTGKDWDTIIEFDGSSTIHEADIRRIVQATKNLQGTASILPAFKTTIDRHARELGLKPDPNLLKTANPIIPQIRAAACEPYL
jgi:hypothetical protein